MKYFAKIKYFGKNFSGFQVQPDKRTVQGVLSEAAAQVFGDTVRVTGCSRTDAGVHANEFCITLESDAATVPADKLPLALARFLPGDISLFFAKECNYEFHPRYDAIGKEYLYRIHNSRIQDPFLADRAWFLPRIISADGLEKMALAAKHLIGEHDFFTFMAAGSDNVTDTVRRVDYINISKEDSIIEIRIRANGFLYNMVRIIVGTLCEVGHGRFAPESLRAMLLARNRASAGMTAPAHGLYLNKVFYDDIV